IGCTLCQIVVLSAHFLPEGISNHCPVKIAQIHGAKRSRQAFKYRNVWAKHPQFLTK
ncbi:hypothetical protein HAX54_000784, partial [Datura stramonium]|nr:hypothetical protein [Datura stramonium]